MKIIQEYERQGWVRMTKMAEYLCDCGETFQASRYQVSIGKVSDCWQCQKKRATDTGHGIALWYPGERTVWLQLHYRCYDPNHAQFHLCGGRGVKVCERWHRDSPQGFKNFIDDIGEIRNRNVLELIDVSGDYQPDNVRIVPMLPGNAKRQATWIVGGARYGSLNNAAKAHKVSTSTVKNWCCGYSRGGVEYPPKDGCKKIPRYHHDA